MTKKEEFEVIVNIAKRAEAQGIGFGDRITKIIDLEFAHNKFDLRLNDFLNADNLDFAHDFIGIQNRIDRKREEWIDDLFLPRFASNASKYDGYNSYLINALQAGVSEPLTHVQYLRNAKNQKEV